MDRLAPEHWTDITRIRGPTSAESAIDLVEALALSWFLEEAARVETGLMSLGQDGDHTLLTPDETVARQVTAGRVYERMWEHLTFGDIELA
jgi:HCOMODA/2-hydroxy-3-carboxy-muconic semialdehyde decarboxylase